MEGYRLYRSLPQARLALSGGYFGSEESQGEVTAKAALALGVDPNDTLQLREGIHTQSEMKQVAQRIGKGEKLIVVSSAIHLPRAQYWAHEMKQVAQRIGKGEKLIVVSSAIHLPRAQYWAQANGMSATMAPAHFLIATDPTKSGGQWQNSPARRIALWRTWAHETVGLMHARWKVE